MVTPVRRRLLLLGAVACSAFAPLAAAKDYGQQGAVFRITEPDLLRTIEQKLRTLEASGGIERMNAELTRRTEAGVRRPRPVAGIALAVRSEEHTSELQSLMRISYAVFCLKKKKNKTKK